EPLTILVVNVQDCCSRGFRSTALEQNSFGGKILIHGLVIIEMIASQISEHSHIEWNPVHPLLRQGMGGTLHHRLGCAMAIRFREHAIQFKCLGSGVWGGEDLPRHVIFDGPYECILASSSREDCLHQNRGVAL